MAAYLPKAIDDADFDFYGKTIGGQAQQLPRDTRAVTLIDGHAAASLRQALCRQVFPAGDAGQGRALVANIVKAYDADIRKITWMTDVTKQKALDKLHAFTPHIGYPDKWRDYSGLAIQATI